MTTLGISTQITFLNLNTTPVDAKVDTGATMSSIDASDIHVDGSHVTFRCDYLSNGVIKMPLVDVQSVHSADGGESKRPVVSFNVDVGGVQIKDAHFNLNDRSNMTSRVLIGQNILKAGDFLIDPTTGGESTTESLDNARRTALLNYIEEVHSMNIDSETQLKLINLVKEAVELSDADMIIVNSTLKVLYE